jgi:FAD/FMN-containing dehydrogenase
LLALINVDGKDEAQLQGDVQQVLEEAMEAGEVLDAIVAQSVAQVQQLWKLREAPAELNNNMHPAINFDVSLPQADIGRFAEACMQALPRAGLRTRRCTSAMWATAISMSRWMARPSTANASRWRSFYRIVGEMQGSVSAEHGIGLHKKPYLSNSRTPAELAAMRAIKLALDPLGLMNPGKVFDL